MAGQSVQERLDALRLRKETLELEILEEQVAQLQNTRANKKRTSAQNEAALLETREALAARQAQCNHHTGGEGMDAIMAGEGTDSNYSVAKITYPWGEIRVMCIRCGMEWVPGDTAAKHPSGFSYKQALAFPTFCRPSGSQIFVIHRKPKPAA